MLATKLFEKCIEAARRALGVALRIAPKAEPWVALLLVIWTCAALTGKALALIVH